MSELDHKSNVKADKVVVFDEFSLGQKPPLGALAAYVALGWML